MPCVISRYKIEPCEILRSFKSNYTSSILNKEVNAIFGQSQIENIMNIINYIKDTSRNEKQELYKKSYLNKCIKWCKKYNLPINDQYN